MGEFMNKKKVAYYNMPGNLDYEKELLKIWKVDNIQLENVRGSDIIHSLLEYNGLVTEYTILTEETLKQLPNLEIIALQSIGYDEIDVESARKLQIDVTNVPGYCSEDVALHAMALFLNLVRQISIFNNSTHQGKWDINIGKVMHRLSGKTAGLISFGNIPQKVTLMLKGFGINVISYDPSKEEAFMKQMDVKKCNTLVELLNQSDFIFLHTPLKSNTIHMINKQTIEEMKDGVILINVSRGALIDEVALIEAIKNEKFSGVGLDVLENEQNRNEELFKFSNVIITPHVAFLSEDSLKQSRRMALEQLVLKLSKSKSPTLIVN